MTHTNADIVTLLRLTQLNDEIRVGDDDCIGGDATFLGITILSFFSVPSINVFFLAVMRDFSHLTCNQRLQHQKHKKTQSTSSSSTIASNNPENTENDNISME